MTQNRENLEGIVSKLKEQGVNAGEAEKQRIIENAKQEAEKLIAEAKATSKKIVEEAETKASQAEKNAEKAIAQASRDMVEATKITILNHLKKVFGKECKTLFRQEEYLKELLKVVIDSISGKKSIKVPPELLNKMEAFILKESLQEEVTLKPLSASKAKIKIKSTDKEGISFVVSSKEIEAGLFSLLNKDLVERITKNQED
jgi:V/A-type H+-transporting ATPase subunit E